MRGYLLILPIGLVAQFVDGTLGMGYGASSSSLLLAAGFLPAAVSASVHAAEIFSSLASGASHLKLGNVDKTVVLPLAAGGVIGGVAGAYFLSNIDSALIRPYIGLLLMILGIRILLTSRKRKGSDIGKRISSRFLVPLGLAGGVVDAIGGGGWGPICTSTIVSTKSGEPRTAIGSVNAAEFLVTLAITITFAFSLGLERFLWHITLPLMIGGVIAAPLSAYACRRIAPGNLSIGIGLVLIVLNLRAVAPVLSSTLGVHLPVKFDLIVVLAAIAAGLVPVFRSLSCRRPAVSEELRQ